jgi:hypothetical protein
MFCPKCGSEYRSGFVRCAECDIELVPDPPERFTDEPEEIEYEEVLSTYNPGDVAVIKSLLDGEGITYFFQGEAVAPYLYNAVPMRLLVRKDEARIASEILADLDLSLTYAGIAKERESGEE